MNVGRSQDSADKEPTETSPLLSQNQPTSSEEPSSTSSSSSYQTDVTAFRIIDEIPAGKVPSVIVQDQQTSTTAQQTRSFLDNGGLTMFASQQQEQSSTLLNITAASSPSMVTPNASH